MFRSSSAYPLLTFALLLAGCSREPLTVQVRGKITHDGKPLAHAVVGFINSKDSGRAAFAVTDADGQYALSTHFGADRFVEGALPDDYGVTVQKVLAPDHRAVRAKMLALGKQNMGKLQRYMKEEAMHDLWPNGVPEGWPPGYIPGVSSPPNMKRGSAAARRIARLGNGLALIPLRYSDARDPCFHASVERRDGEALIINFELFGEPEDGKLPADDKPELSHDDGVDTSANAGPPGGQQPTTAAPRP